MKIITVIGARPQFIKAALVSLELTKRNVDELIIHTGQHYDDNMSSIFFEQLNIKKPSFNLNIKAFSHGKMTGEMLMQIEDVLLQTLPDLVLVYGDTNSTLAAALAAKKLNIPVAHVEAGLRNYDFSIPEDINRILTDRISDILFCSTEQALQNLNNEGFALGSSQIFKTDDLMSDTVKTYGNLILQKPDLVSGVLRSINYRFILCTVHRQESTKNEKLPDIVNALNSIAEECQIVFPMHPRTKKICNDLNLKFSSNIKIIDPVGYFDMLFLLQNSIGVITDSGGLQKEAFLCCKYSLLLMPFTPWVELVQNHVSVTTDIDKFNILYSFELFKKLNGDFGVPLYGFGNASSQIADALLTFKQQIL